MAKHNLHPKAYFQLQMDFAERVAAIRGVSLQEAILTSTTFYKSIGIENWDFNLDDQTWKEFLERFTNTEEGLSVMYGLYLEKQDTPEKNTYFGCFRYEYKEETKGIHVHFRNADDLVPGVLSKERREVRIKELKGMFADIKARYPEAKTVSGFSWLYNLEAYKRLYPPEYTSHFELDMRGWYGTRALWGQFLNKFGGVKEDAAAQFRSCIQSKTSVEELGDCFPFRILKPTTEIRYFYKFYGLE